MFKSPPLLVVAISLLSLHVAFSQETGRITGWVLRPDESAVEGVTVVVNEISAATITDHLGVFTFDRVPAGAYSITFILGNNSDTELSVAVNTGETARVEKIVDWEIGFVETVTVTSASLQRERIVEAPAAITVVDEQEIQTRAGYGQIPKLVEFTPSAQVTQSGLYDYNVNTRGFNSSLNRRVATLIDGRNPAVPFLGAQEWAGVSFPADDLARVELLRGPSAALYGANASSGVLNLTTKAPRQTLGGRLRFTAGELDTANLDFRWAGAIGNGWYLKTVGGLRATGDYTVSRNPRIESGALRTVEYSTPCPPQGPFVDCLPLESVPLDPENKDRIYFGGLRVDKYLSDESFITAEGGISDISGPVFQTGLGRVQLQDVKRPWLRFNFTAPRWNFLAYYTGRDAPKQRNLRPGTNIALDTYNLTFEGQTNWTFAEDKVRVVVGASYGHENINSADPDTGRQTAIFEPVSSDRGAIFGQADWSVTDKFKVIVAGRFDDSTLYDAQFSPKAALVYSVDANNTLRFTVNRAFQVPNYSEFFLQADVAAPQDLGRLEGLCAPFGVNCGFTQPTRVLALGNESLDVEELTTWEIGYSGILQKKAFLTIDYYNSNANDFITDLLPQLGTPLGRTNPNFGPWEPPQPLPPPVVAGIRSAVPLLSNNLDGSNIIAALSYSNFGQVDTQGIDIGLNYYFLDPWKLAFSYSWFDFNPQEDVPPGFDPLLEPNSPEHSFQIGLAYLGGRWGADVAVRWVDEFRWSVGIFQGDVLSYTTVDLNANYTIVDHWTVGGNISNLFDEKHYESFGGDIIKRRALAYVAYDWD